MSAALTLKIVADPADADAAMAANADAQGAAWDAAIAVEAARSARMSAANAAR